MVVSRGERWLILLAWVCVPGVDPVTTLVEMAPMLVLYEFSILLASWIARFDRVR